MSIMLIRTQTPFASGLEFEQKAAMESARLSQSEHC
jgi:hypothetical protein